MKLFLGGCRASCLPAGRLVLACSTKSWADPPAATPSPQRQVTKLIVGKMSQTSQLTFCRTESLDNGNAPQPITPEQLLTTAAKNGTYLKSQEDLVDSTLYSPKSANGNRWPNELQTNSFYQFDQHIKLDSTKTLAMSTRQPR
jgi:hypothetical protein